MQQLIIYFVLIIIICIYLSFTLYDYIYTDSNNTDNINNANTINTDQVSSIRNTRQYNNDNSNNSNYSEVSSHASPHTSPSLHINVKQEEQITPPVPPIVPPVPVAPITPVELLREYDYKTLSDPLTPPWKRDDYFTGVLPSIATRGYPSAFKKFGLLVDETLDNNDKYKFLILVGRRKYPNADYYEYYATTDDSQTSAIKFDIPNIHKELFTDAKVEIVELGKTYTLKRDKTLTFEYYPYLY